jgi:ribosomal protein S18 acetylase RimI-like enzyme
MSASVPPVTRIDPADVMPTLLVAFADDPGMRWLYPDDGTYERALPEVVLLAAGAAFDAGTVDVAEGGTAVAIWDPPGSDRDPQEVGAAWAAHFQVHVDAARLGDVFAWGEQMGRCHPTEPHWYLATIGVTPEHQGRGHGAALLRAGLDRCDRDGLPAYLESGNPRNRTLYERHGFEVIDEIRIADSPPIWPMLRSPHPVDPR